MQTLADGNMVNTNYVSKVLTLLSDLQLWDNFIPPDKMSA